MKYKVINNLDTDWLSYAALNAITINVHKIAYFGDYLNSFVYSIIL